MITAVTSLPVHSSRAQARVARLQACQPDNERIPVDFYVGDAVWRPSDSARSHPFSEESARRFDVVFGLDCCYHLDTRKLFLRQTMGRLSVGGRVVTADICFDAAALRSSPGKLVRWLLPLMPVANVVSKERYIRDMDDLGFCEIEMADISEDVFPKFTAFLKRQGWAWWIFGTILHCYYVYAGARFVVVTGKKGNDN
jgi:hypothetical protein